MQLVWKRYQITNIRNVFERYLQIEIHVGINVCDGGRDSAATYAEQLEFVIDRKYPVGVRQM